VLLVLGSVLEIYSAIIILTPSWPDRRHLRHRSGPSRRHFLANLSTGVLRLLGK
jgi:hypothetical protein